MTDVPSALTEALAGTYDIERELGEGGMATVYLAKDVKHHREVAIKVLKPELAASVGPDRFLQEIRTTANLRHPHIVPLYDSGAAGGFLFYVMPFIEGESLQERLAREVQLPVEESIRLAEEVAGALSYAHARGVIHRDIKPGNIMLEAGHAVVTDFGIASAVSLAGGQRLTQTGMIVGTPAYMSPEQASGQSEPDARSDLYSLACVAYEMLAGQAPFTAPTAAVVLARHMFDPVPPLTTARPGLAPHVARAVERALAKTPIDRFDGAETWAAALVSPPAESAGGLATPPRAAPATVSSGGPESLAVVPLVNLSGDPSQEFFAAGMHDAIISELARIGALTVISRTSVMRYKDSGHSISEIAAELGVDGIVEGSVLHAGDRVRISLQLVQASPEKHLWAESYERDVTDVLALHGEMARAVAEAVSATLTTDEVERLSRTETVDPAAYELYLRGRHLDLGVEKDGQRRVAFFEQAIELAPDFARPYASLARTLMWLAQFGFEPAGPTLERAKQAATRALELDPTSGEALAAAGHLETMYDREVSAGRRDLERAIEAEPNNVEALNDLGWHLTIVGEFDRAVEVLERAGRVDPFSMLPTVIHGWSLFMARRWEESIAVVERGLERMPQAPHIVLWLAAGHAWNGDHERALELARLAERLEPSDSNLDLYAVLVLVYREIGATEDAVRVAGLIERHAERPGVSWFMGLAAIARGDLDGAVAFFEQAADERFPMVVLLPIHPMADTFWSHAGLVEVANRVNIRPGFTVRQTPPDEPHQAHAEVHAEVAASQPAIAVLPFVSMSADADDEFFADGISEEIINALAGIPDLKVAARTSAFSFKGKDEDLRVIGEKLGVSTVLEGSVRRAGNRLRITAQLIGVEDGYHLWSERFDRELEDVFAVQDEIAQSIATRLQVTLSGKGDEGEDATTMLEGSAAQLGTSNVEAYESYLKGRHLWYQRSPASMAAAGGYFEQAIALDPGFASAYAGLADSFSVRRAGGYVAYADTHDRVAFATRRAMELAPDRAESHITAAYYDSYYGEDWPLAEGHWQRALELDPRSSLAHAQYGLFLAAHRRPDEQREHAAIARELDPLSPFPAMLDGMGLYFLQDFEAALRSLDAALELQANFPLGLLLQGGSFLALGQYERARDVLSQSVSLTNRNVLFVGCYGDALARSGDPDAARRLLDELEGRKASGEYVTPIGSLRIRLGLGDREGALAALEEALSDRMPPITLAFAPIWALESLLDEPRAAELLTRLRFPPCLPGAV